MSMEYGSPKYLLYIYISALNYIEEKLQTTQVM